MVPGLWSGSAFANAEWSKYGSADELSIEPGFFVGIAPRVALGATVSFFDEGEGWNFTSVSPMLQVQLTPAHWPVRLAVSAGYEFADTSAQLTPEVVTIDVPATTPVTRQVPTLVRVPVTPPPDPDPGPCGPEFGPDAPPCPDTTKKGLNVRHGGHGSPEPIVVTRTVTTTTQGTKTVTRRTKVVPPTPTSTGIHRHGEDHLFARLIVEASLSPADQVTFNLLTVSPRQGKPAWGYAAAWRHTFSHQWSASLEAWGDFGEANEHEVVLGGFWSPTHHTTFKFGAGAGLTDESPDFSVRTGLVWRF